MTRIHKICIVGGTGFVGRHLAPRLARAGYNLRIPTRHAFRHRDLQVLPNLELIEADIHEERTLGSLFADCQAVINLVGILNERGHDGSGFRRVHVDLPRKIVDTCHAKGVHRLLHMSALGAEDTPETSFYLRTKAEGEKLVHLMAGDNLAVTSFRPSVIFGPGDSFLNRFAKLLRVVPGVFPLACAKARFQPVYVGDVANAFHFALEDQNSFGERLDLCGPRIYTLEELVHYTAGLIGVKRLIVPLPDWMSRLQASILEYFPGKPFSLDNYRSLQKDSICPEGVSTCPTALESIAPLYLGGEDWEDRLQRLREQARRT